MPASSPHTSELTFDTADGMGRTRAKRISKERWDQHMDLIRALYAEMTLEHLMIFMKREHDFEPTKRQYIYKLGNWGATKYSCDKKRPRTPEDDNGFVPEGSPKMQRVVGPYLGNNTGGLPLEFNLPIDCYKNHDTVAMLTPVSGKFSFPGDSNSISTDLPPEDPDSSNDCTDLPWKDDSSATPQQDWRTLANYWPTSEQLKKRAAHCLFALSDDGAAFRLYTSLPELERERPDFASITGRLAIIYCARSAKEDNHADRVRNFLKPHLSTSKSNAECFLFRMLDAYTYNRSEKPQLKDYASHLMSEALASVLDRGNNLLELPSHHSSIDMVTYLCIAYGLNKYAQMHSVDGSINGPNSQPFMRKDILQKYVNQQPLVAGPKVGFRATGSLRNCVQWCRDQLARNPPLPLVIGNVPYYEKYANWKEHIELFCSLWGCWQGGYPSNEPTWTQTAEMELGLSAEELLVTISRLIMQCGTRRGSLGREKGNVYTDVQMNLGHNDSRTLTERAYYNARVLADWDDKKLWEEFLDKFLYMNALVDLSDEEKLFKEAAMIQVRAFVGAAVHVTIPTSDPVENDGIFQLDMVEPQDALGGLSIDSALDFPELQHLEQCVHGGEQNYSSTNATGLQGALNMGQSYNDLTTISHQEEIVDLS